MAEDDTSERKESTERRVYILPANLLERLRSYQVSQGIASEAEAARRLLDSALQMRDTVDDILNTIENRFQDERDLRVLASEVLARHALIRQVSFTDSSVAFKLANGERGKLSDAGDTYISSYDMDEDDWTKRKNKFEKSFKRSNSVSKNVGGDLDDEIPF